MTEEEIRKQMLKDSYIDISFKKYLAFKETAQYDEAYKKEILSGLNHFLKGQEMNELTVLDIVKKLRKENPTAGSFVHWSITDDLVKYTEASPGEVAELLNQLFSSSLSIEERIDLFREKAKQFNPAISLGAPLFGYLFAAIDYTKYSIYKQEVFTDLKKSYGIELKLGSVGNNYQTYLTMCQIALEHFKPNYSELTILDMQDFFFCSTQYNEIMVESAVEYLYGIAVELADYMKDPKQMLEYLAKLEKDQLINLREQYRHSEKINLIKFMVLERILQSGSIRIEEMEKIKNQVKERYETNILQSWNNFTILFQLYYADKKAKVQEEQRKIHRAIRQMAEFQELDFEESKVLNGFNWNQNFGCSRCWLAVYEKGNTTHRTAPQFFVAVDEKGIEYGLLYGDQHPKQGGHSDILFSSDMESFTYEIFHQRMAEVLHKYQEPNEETVVENNPPYQLADEISTEIWNEFLQNKDIFYESDFVYLIKMYELGGEATTAQLGKVLDRHPSSFISPVVSLAKRVLKEVDMNPPKRADGSDAYWAVLFEGENTEDNHFLWRLKPNLKEALAAVKGEEDQVHLETYSKEDFLTEVFIDEEKYETIIDLLRYKKNIIFQGPPGVGKTFVSKRLAYSLMGVKDPDRVEMVQFHQNYAYEDFVMGFRPNEQGFSLQYGIFYDFCDRALKNPEQDYFFVIDEINRGNLSKIFGELFMLIERDKRDEFVTMGYSKEPFTVPSNVYLIGTMNTADRSLAQLEIALRRRFAFVTLTTAFNNKWRTSLLQSGVTDEMVNRIQFVIEKINNEITGDFQLGSGYAIGHSFFTLKSEHLDENTWFKNIMRFEIIPLLEEYYFDRPETVQSLIEGI